MRTLFTVDGSVGMTPAQLQLTRQSAHKINSFSDLIIFIWTLGLWFMDQIWEKIVTGKKAGRNYFSGVSGSVSSVMELGLRELNRERSCGKKMSKQVPRPGSLSTPM